MTKIEIRCLGCGNIFSRKTNGVKYQFQEKNNVVTNMETKERDTCDKCDSPYLMFEDYYDPKRVRIF